MSDQDHNAVLRICLLRIAPGYLRVVAGKLRGVLNKAQVRGEVLRHRLYVCFGDYDMLLLARTSDDSIDLLGDGWIEGVTGVRDIPCHTWFPDDDALFDAIVDSALVSITFLQLHPAAFHDFGLSLEQELACATRNWDVPTVPLAVYGLPEMAVLRPWNSPPDIPSCVDESVRRGNDLAARHGFKFPLLYRTLTFVGIEYPIPWKALSRSKDKTPTHIELNISATPGWVKQMARSARKAFGLKGDAAQWTSGTYDVTLSVPVSSAYDLGTCAKVIIEFREKHAASILATSCTLRFAADAREIVKNLPCVLRAPMRTPTKQEGELLKSVLDESLGRRLVKTCYNFNDLVLNPSMSPAILDLCMPVATLIEDSLDCVRAVRAGSMDVRVVRTRIGERLIPLHSAVDQRTIAAHATVSPVESHCRYLVGGFSRLLLAAESIPLSLFRQQGRLWLGYAVAGALYPDFVHQHWMINLPPSTLLHPESWFPVLHEALHSYIEYWDMETFDKGKGEMAEVFGRCEGTVPGVGQEGKQEAMGEAVVDILTFNSGPCWNQRLYFCSVWDYLFGEERHERLESEMERRFASWFFRNSCVWLADWPFRSERTNPRVATPSGAAAALRKMVARYQEWGLDRVVKQAKRLGLTGSDALRNYSHFWPLIEFSRRQRLFSHQDITKRASYYRQQAAGTIKRAAANKWKFDQRVPYPELLVWKLKEMFSARGHSDSGPDIGTRHRAAVLLLLCDSHWRIRRETLGSAELVK